MQEVKTEITILQIKIMLYEITDIDRTKDSHYCRWFTDSFFDLFIWYNNDKTIFGFQLCYSKRNKERAFSWWQKEGYSHHKVDDGEGTGRSKMTPILVADGKFDYTNIVNIFKKCSKNIDKSLVDFILTKLSEYKNKA